MYGKVCFESVTYVYTNILYLDCLACSGPAKKSPWWCQEPLWHLDPDHDFWDIFSCIEAACGTMLCAKFKHDVIFFDSLLLLHHDPDHEFWDIFCCIEAECGTMLCPEFKHDVMFLLPPATSSWLIPTYEQFLCDVVVTLVPKPWKPNSPDIWCLCLFLKTDQYEPMRDQAVLPSCMQRLDA